MDYSRQDPHHVLGLPRNSSKELIKKTFRQLSLQFHPDKNSGGSEKFVQIASAYRILMNTKTRASSVELVNPDKNSTLSENSSEWAKQFFPVPSEDNFNEKVKVAVFIGGVLVGAYISYRMFHTLHSTLPVPETVIQQSVGQEVSEMHPASLWTLISWLAALRSKRLLGLGKLTSRLPTNTLTTGLSSAADRVAETATQGTRSVISSANTNSPLSSAANVVAKSLTPKPQIKLNSAAEVAAKTITQASQAALASASKPLSPGPHNEPPALKYKATKLLIGLLRYWKWAKKFLPKGAGFSSTWEMASVNGTVRQLCSVSSSAARSTAKVLKVGALKAMAMRPDNAAIVIPFSSAITSSS
ncbi:uncharacterized protein LOC108093563 [Drosophila ficusphila]|uniref:uncharacterized protein LOC108093563 n=1 Tax=Drosophila ficusphila TaxID=30025 RepID=UPI0007E83221|nr:uncharacterized protein LOC108093563 [Drosophila ficusphila]